VPDSEFGNVDRARKGPPILFAVVNQKGGVGKSTTSVNLTACLAELGMKVLLVDLDPQGNATSGFGLNKNEREHCIYSALLEDVETRLKQTLASVEDDFDVVIIDCPPSLGLLTINALTAANRLIIPIQCEYYALEGLSKLLDSIRLVKTHLNPELEIFGVVMTMYDSRTKLSNQVVDEVGDFFPTLLFKTLVQPITLYDPNGKGSAAYRELAKEVIDRV
jgi:chromosome partitioning protein